MPKIITDTDLMTLHRLVRAMADDLTANAASETRDLDSYLLALMHATIGGKVPCNLQILKRLHALAQSEGFE